MSRNPIEPETDSSQEETYDSGFETDTTSLKSSILGYEYENGRRYHAFKPGTYVLPNDETEQDRLDMVHHLFTLMLGGKLHLAPLENPHRILDVGTGTGIWALDMAEQYPEAEVLGTDLSPIQPGWVFPNVQFQVDDAEQEWTFPDGHFDFIHIRSLCPSIKNWPRFLEQCYRADMYIGSMSRAVKSNSEEPPETTLMKFRVFLTVFANSSLSSCLKPGGYVEVIEWCESGGRSDDGTAKGSSLEKYYKLLNEAAEKSGGSFYMDTPLETIIKSAGFVNYHETILKLPLGGWAKDKKLKEIGKWFQLIGESGFEAYGLALFTRVLGMDVVEIKKLIKECQREVRERKVHAYGNTWFTYGQKPLRN